MRCFHPIAVREWVEDKNGRKVRSNSTHLVPCGHCVACLSRRRNDWSFRLTKEQASSSYSFFLTLTYDQENIPIKIKDGTPYFVFNKSHVQNYLKRVRYFVSELNKDIVCRFYAVSEYGKRTQRPHYHMQFFVRGDDNMHYYKSICKILSDCWKYGNTRRDVSSAANIHYVTKYCIKYLDELDSTCIDEPFILCSKRPYLGEYAESELEKTHFSLPVVFNHGMRQAMPRIYRNKLGFQGCNIPESEDDPRFSASTYNDALALYRKTHSRFSMLEFRDYMNKRLINFESDAIRRQMTRNEKL